MTSLKCNVNPNGTFTTNDESEGATVTRVAQGEYIIEGVLGFNSDAGWGGVDVVLKFHLMLINSR
ncbi:TPA: hypothetical protein SMQ30_001184 [Proteus mirabilis]|nr:hypothetical protein [Proteus mirabilis]